MGNHILSNLYQNCRCMNSWKSKWHDRCNARFTLSFSNQIQELIIENEARSKKECKKRYKLISFENEALFNTLNYQIICPSCHPSVSCPRHSHISYCTDPGPKPNPKAKVTKNGPTRISQRVFRQKFKNEVYLHPKNDFLDSYNETKSQFLKEMDVDSECENYVEYQGISTLSERYIYDHMFSVKCANPLHFTG